MEFVAVGNDELGREVKKGDKVTNGDIRGTLEYGIDSDTGKESNMIGFVKAQDGECYLVAIKDQLVFGWRKI